MNDLEKWLPRPGETEPDQKFHRIQTNPDILTTRIERTESGGCVIAMDIETHTMGLKVTRQDVRFWVDGHLVSREDFRDAELLLRSAGARCTRVENGAKL